MLTKVVELSIVPPYGIRVRFSNGQMGIHDCSKLTHEPGSMIEPLRDPDVFRPRVSRIRRADLAQRVRHVARVAAPGNAGGGRVVRKRGVGAVFLTTSGMLVVTPSETRQKRCDGQSVASSVR